MASAEKDNLPRPGTFSIVNSQIRRASAAGSMVFTNRPDPALAPRRITFNWQNARGEVADAIRRHYKDHVHATFTLTMPRTGEAVVARWLSPPSIQWNSAVSASVTGEFEELLAHE